MRPSLMRGPVGMSPVLRASAAALMLGVSSMALTHVLHAQEAAILEDADPN